MAGAAAFETILQLADGTPSPMTRKRELSEEPSGIKQPPAAKMKLLWHSQEPDQEQLPAKPFRSSFWDVELSDMASLNFALAPEPASASLDAVLVTKPESASRNVALALEPTSASLDDALPPEPAEPATAPHYVPEPASASHDVALAPAPASASRDVALATEPASASHDVALATEPASAPDDVDPATALLTLVKQVDMAAVSGTLVGAEEADEPAGSEATDPVTPKSNVCLSSGKQMHTPRAFFTHAQ